MNNPPYNIEIHPHVIESTIEKFEKCSLLLGRLGDRCGAAACLSEDFPDVTSETGPSEVTALLWEVSHILHFVVSTCDQWEGLLRETLKEELCRLQQQAHGVDFGRILKDPACARTV